MTPSQQESVRFHGNHMFRVIGYDDTSGQTLAEKATAYCDAMDAFAQTHEVDDVMVKCAVYVHAHIGGSTMDSKRSKSFPFFPNVNVFDGDVVVQCAAVRERLAQSLSEWAPALAQKLRRESVAAMQSFPADQANVPKTNVDRRIVAEDMLLGQKDGLEQAIRVTHVAQTFNPDSGLDEDQARALREALEWWKASMLAFVWNEDGKPNGNNKRIHDFYDGLSPLMGDIEASVQSPSMAVETGSRLAF